MTAPVGQTGCMANSPKAEWRPFSIGLSYGFSDTRMVFVGAGRHRFRQSAYTLSFVGVLKNGLVLGAAIGPNMGGRIEGLLNAPDETWTIRPGVVWSLTIARRFFGSEPQYPFLLLAGTFSGSSTSTRRDSDGARSALNAFDAKADVSVGWTIGESFSPYMAVRAFGGPVLWRPEGERTFGGDLYHVSVAAGFNLSIVNRVAVYFDGAFVGMRGLSGGLAVRF
ncbi:hypothetical protein ACNOYE_03700 [Nannocystaceae bacterium ST9]